MAWRSIDGDVLGTSPVAPRRRSSRYRLDMLGSGDQVPDVEVWEAPREQARPLKDILGAGFSLLCFYVYDWSPG